MLRSYPLVLFFLFLARGLHADSARDESVRHDLNYLVQQIVGNHPNPFGKVSQDDFYQNVQNLSDRIPVLTDRESYIEMMALIASIGDSHTTLSFDDALSTRLALQSFPLRPTLYDDGLFVSTTTAEYARYLGWRVNRINGRTMDEWIPIIGRFISHDNDQWLKYWASVYLRIPEFLSVMSGDGDSDGGVWELERRSGQRVSLELAGGPNPTAAAVNDPAIGYLSPTYLDGNLNYWFRYYPEQRLLFFKYNVCAQRPDLPFSQFAAQLFATLGSNTVDALVVDLRDNPGGDSSVWQPFLDGLRTRYSNLRTNSQFRLYGLISRFTFSSGMFAAESIKTFDGSLLVGEDTGGNPEAYGNVAYFQLPESGIRGQVSTQYFSARAPGITAPAVHPDVRAYRDSTDVFARFDPILFKIFALSDPRAPRGEENRTRAVVSTASLRLGSVQAANSLSSILGTFDDSDGSSYDVTVAGQSAKVLRIGSERIDFQQPSAVTAGEQDVAVTRNGDSVYAGTETIADAAPAIWMSDPTNIRSPGGILNADGTTNSTDNPALRGEVVRIAATGYPATGESARVLIGQWDMVVVAESRESSTGLWQIDARIPDVDGVAKLMPVIVMAAGRISNAVTIWISN